MAITNGYATLSDVKAALRISDDIDNDLLELSIESASRLIDGYTQRSFYSAGTATRYYTPDDSYRTEIDDLISISSLQTSSDGNGFTTTWAATDYQLEPRNQIAGGLAFPYTKIFAIGSNLFPIWDSRDPDSFEATVKVIGVWGWSAVPKAIKQATIILASRQFKRYDSPLGVAGFGDLGAMRVSAIDPDVEALVLPFRKFTVS
jgi:hypothetical protein